MSSVNIEEYNIVSPLGQGMFGEVHKVERKSDGKLFAMKKIGITYLKRLRSSMERLEREVDSHKSLPQHPNILDFIEYYKTRDYMHIVLELCDLGNLEEYIIDRRPDHETALSFMMDMARGLNHLHRHGIVHRDIKPENILLAASPKTIPQCKISDFGVANMSSYEIDTRPIDSMKNLTGEKYFTTLCGTPIYLAPEVTERHYTKACDIFSLGVVFYILFSPQRDNDGRLAPWVKNGTVFYRAEDNQIVEQIREYISDEKLCDLISAMLKVDYHDRISAPVVEERLVPMMLLDDEVFLVACLISGVFLILVLFPFPLFVLCVGIIYLLFRELVPNDISSTYRCKCEKCCMADNKS